MDTFLVELRQHLPNLSSHAMTNTIWALAKLDHKPGVDWMDRFLDRVIALTGTTPLVMSADFSSIILHGLTAWAASRLNFAFTDVVEWGAGRDCLAHDELGLLSSTASDKTGSAPSILSRQTHGRTVDLVLAST